MTSAPRYQLPDKSFNKRTNNALNLFWAGYIIYTTCYALMISDVVPYKITYLQLLGVVIFIIPTIHLIKLKIESKYLRNIYIIYVGWIFFTISRGFSLNKQFLFDTIIDQASGIFLYLAPFIVLFPKNPVYLKKVINVIIILSIFYILYDMAFIKALLAYQSENGQSIIEYFSKILAIPCGFILLTVVYHSDKKKKWAFLIIILTFLLAVVRARRGLMFMTLNILVFTYIIYNYAYKNNLFFKIFPLMLIFFLSIYAINLYNQKSPGPLKFIKERLKEDTRSDVEEYFYLDLTKKDWIMGKGISGSYYCPTGATPDGYRTNIETDYLNIILKGGLISLGLLLLIAVPAIFLGLFYSKNTLSKGAALWIIVWMVELFPAPITTFSLTYLLVWISIGICYSKEIRNMPENVVKEYFQYKPARSIIPKRY